MTTDPTAPVPSESPRAQLDRLLPMVDRILAIFEAEDLAPQDGEFVCLWIAGMSLGIRAESVKASIPTLARGWLEGAKRG